jgi:hypothetical protein
LKRVLAHVTAATVFAALALLIAAPLTALAKDEPGKRSGEDGNQGHHYGQISNPGHHYGQLKHHHQSPPPSPSQVPAPTPNPGHNPASNPGGSGAKKLNVIVRDPGSVAPAAQTSGDPDVTISLPAQNQAAARAGDNALPADALDWLILLILPALIAIWIIAFIGIARKLTGRKQAVRAAALASAPTV